MILPRSARDIVMIGNAYGGSLFWLEILQRDSFPENIWRSLLYFGCLRKPGMEPLIRDRLQHTDSRVRAWSCFALSQLNDEAAVEPIHNLLDDPSLQIQVHARHALHRLVGPESLAHFENPACAGDSTTILISDDSARVQGQLASVLDPLGLRYVTASRAEETLTLAPRLKPAVIISDNQKGKDNTSGLRMTQAIARSPDLEECLLIMCSGDFVEAVFLWQGGDQFIHKQMGGLTQLRAYVATWLCNSRSTG